MTYPVIIQGGMGVNVSSWKLANAVSREGQMGVVSGTAMDEVLVRNLQIGDPGGHYRRALDNFPVPEVSKKILHKFYIPDGKPENEPFKLLPKFTINPPKELQEITIAANFAEVFLAKEGHDGPVGINFLDKIFFPNIFSIYGAMLAGVDYIIMGAGLPLEVPGVMDKFTTHSEASMKVPVKGVTNGDSFHLRFDPKKLFQTSLPELKRPRFLGIISTLIAANILLKKSTGKVDGFIIETHTAGGHNAPPRGKMVMNDRMEPVYGDRDRVDIEKMSALDIPFWLAGSYGTPEKLKAVLDLGAKGIQVGTVFAFSDESGFTRSIKDKIIPKIINGTADVFTDPKCSPSGFPFKVVSLEGSVSENDEYQQRTRTCDMGYLRSFYKKEDGTLGYRCPAEPGTLYIKKGGKPEELEGRKCLCNALLANIGLAQRQKDGYLEMPLVTAGDDIGSIPQLLKNGGYTYSAKDVLEYLLGN